MAMICYSLNSMMGLRFPKITDKQFQMNKDALDRGGTGVVGSVPLAFEVEKRPFEGETGADMVTKKVFALCLFFSFCFLSSLSAF